MAAAAMLLRVRRLLLVPGPAAPEPGPGPGHSGDSGRSRRRRRSQSSDEVEQHPWKRIKMGELADSVRRAAQGVWNTTGEVLSWLKNRGLSPHPPLPPPPDPPPAPTNNPTRPPRRSRRGTPASVRSPSQDSPSPMDESFLSPSGDSSWTPVSRPLSTPLPRERALRGGGDEGAALSRRPLHSPRSLRTLHRHSRGGAAPTPPHGAVPVQRPSRTLNPRRPPLPPPPPPPPQTPAMSNPRVAQRTPIRARPKTISTVEESIRREEREIYRQLLEVVTSDYERSASFPPSSPPSRRCLDSTRKDRAPTPPKCLPEGRGEPLIADEPPPCLPPWIASSCSPQQASDTPSSPSPSLPLETVAADTVSTGSDTESVIVVKVKEAPRRQNQRMPSFDAVLWIQELTSMYDYRARQRRRLIEEQEALAERLRQQRLQERLPEWGREGSQLRLTVPLVEEVPIGDDLHREIAPEIGERERGDGAPEREEEEEEELPEITEEMQEEVFRAFRAGNQDEVLTEGFRLTITRKDIHTLSHLNWLNDEVINFYMNLLVERSKSRSLPSVHAFNTFFFPKIRSDGYSAVKRWTKRADIFSNDLLLVPIHLGVHWCLAVVDFRKKTISYYDSMGGSNQEACRILLRYIQEESLDKRKRELDVRGWSLGSKRSQDIPQQMNGSDCGMFTCKYADYISRDKPLHFTQKDMPFFRQLVAWEILHQTLL